MSQGDFLDRVERDVLSRKDKLAKFEQGKELDISFAPKINSKSTKLRPRSSYELSSGDLLRKETNYRMSRLRLEQEQSVELTFQPEISKKAAVEGKSVIKAATVSTGQFVEWYKETRKKFDDKRVKAIEDRKQKELEACTFAPTTKSCPSYVKRIAKSMAIIKAAKNLDISRQSNNKPDWK